MQHPCLTKPAGASIIYTQAVEKCRSVRVESAMGFMCEITGVTGLEDKIIISCSPYDGAFIDSKTLRIYDKDNKAFVTTDFLLDRTRSCFNDNASAPWIMLKATIPDSFLRAGNIIELA